jgi:hypothetical protein
MMSFQYLVGYAAGLENGTEVQVLGNGFPEGAYTVVRGSSVEFALRFNTSGYCRYETGVSLNCTESDVSSAQKWKYDNTSIAPLQAGLPGGFAPVNAVLLRRGA